MSGDVTTQRVGADDNAGPSLASEPIPYEVFGAHRPALSYFAIFDEYREQATAFRLDAGPKAPAWMMTRLGDIREAFQHPEIFSSSAVIPSAPDPSYRLIPEMLDAPEHAVWRKLLGKLFAPRAVELFDPWVRDRASSLTRDLVTRGSCDFVADFAMQFPNSVFMDILGLPQDEVATFLTWEDQILHGNHADPCDEERSSSAMQEVMAYFGELVAERRRSPKEDLISTAIGFQIDGSPVRDEDLLSVLAFLFMAGLDTVAIQLSYSFLHLATHPSDRERIVRDPSSIPGFIEDFLRVYSFVTPARKVTQDLDFNGCPMKAGDMVYLPIASANRDPREFPDPATVDADRASNRHIAFGAGPHRCLGSHLARRELKIALEEWHERIPSYTIAAGAQVTERGQQIGVIQLPLSWPA